ncbi:MAG: response regulator transcription factor [Planctomycetaceae bacterium]|nr:response regulator transcription factor [Planctomycetaceae bacterium]
MAKKVLDVGNCVPDHDAIRRLIMSHFDAEVAQAHGLDDALQALRQGSFDLILINRKLDRDSSEGMIVLEAIKADTELASTPIMLVTNFEDHQQLAVQAGAVAGFGKLALQESSTIDKLAEWLS